MPSVIANFLGRPKIEVFLERRQASPAFLVSTEVCMRLSFVVEDTQAYIQCFKILIFGAKIQKEK